MCCKRLLLCLRVMLPAVAEAMVLSSTDNLFLVFGKLHFSLILGIWIDQSSSQEESSGSVGKAKVDHMENEPSVEMGENELL